jgi:hypothetical protein
MEQNILLFVLVGFLAQIIDGALGMAYGVSSNTFLLSIGIPPAAASASVHMAEVVTTGISGLSHWRLGNINYIDHWPYPLANHPWTADWRSIGSSVSRLVITKNPHPGTDGNGRYPDYPAEHSHHFPVYPIIYTLLQKEVVTLNEVKGLFLHSLIRRCFAHLFTQKVWTPFNRPFFLKQTPTFLVSSISVKLR